MDFLIKEVLSEAHAAKSELKSTNFENKVNLKGDIIIK